MDKLSRLQNSLNTAEDTLLQTEVALKKIKIVIEVLDREIGILTVVEGNLIANINVLKNRNIVPLAELYRKTRSDLAVARNRRSILRVDRENHLRVQARIEKGLEQARENYRLALKKLREPERNVIQGKFGRKNGQKRTSE